MSYYPEFGELLNNYLLEQSASSLAKGLNVHPSTVAKWLSGDSRPKDPETVIRIADLLGVHNKNERQKLMEAAGYAYVEAQDQGDISKNAEASSVIGPSGTIGVEQVIGGTDQETPLGDAIEVELKNRKSSWTLQNRLGTVAGGVGLILLIGLGHPLLRDWPLGEIIFFGTVCILLLMSAIFVWYKIRQGSKSFRYLDSHSRRARIAILSLLVMSILLWVGVGLPKLWGVWSYPSRDEDGDQFGHSVITGDFNGDSYDDLVLSAPGEAPGFISSSKSGWVYTYHGTVPKPMRGAGFGQMWLGLNEKDDQFGWSTAVGDFDGDGMDDLAVGAPGEARGDVYKAGYVFLYKGTRRGLIAWQGIGQDELGHNEVDDRFGWALAAGDFNGDGQDDLAIGAPGEKPGTSEKSGYVFVFTGTPKGLNHWFGYDQRQLSENERDDQFGSALAAGDFDGDGVDDLAIGAPGEASDQDETDSPSGAVFVFRGSIHGLQEWSMLDQSTAIAITPDAQFGWALAVGDFNNDRKDDLAIGAPQAISTEGSDGRQSGAVYIFNGTSEEFIFSQVIDQAGMDNNEDGDQFGWSLTTGDFTGDLNVELVVGAPGEVVESDTSAPKSGYVYSFIYDEKDFKPLYSLSQNDFGHNDPGDLFGWSLAAGDLDGNGKDELIVGAPGEKIFTNNRSGFAFVFHASNLGMTGWTGYHQE